MFRDDLVFLQVLSPIETEGQSIHDNPLYTDYQKIFLRYEYVTICLMIISQISKMQYPVDLRKNILK